MPNWKITPHNVNKHEDIKSKRRFLNKTTSTTTETKEDQFFGNEDREASIRSITFTTAATNRVTSNGISIHLGCLFYDKSQNSSSSSTGNTKIAIEFKDKAAVDAFMHELSGIETTVSYSDAKGENVAKSNHPEHESNKMYGWDTYLTQPKELEMQLSSGNRDHDLIMLSILNKISPFTEEMQQAICDWFLPKNAPVDMFSLFFPDYHKVNSDKVKTAFSQKTIIKLPKKAEEAVATKSITGTAELKTAPVESKAEPVKPEPVASSAPKLG